jgi:hypothetical protein
MSCLDRAKGETTTRCLTEVDAVFAVDPGLTLEGILVVLGLLQQNPNALCTVLLDEPLRDFPLARVEFLDRQ